MVLVSRLPPGEEESATVPACVFVFYLNYLRLLTGFEPVTCGFSDGGDRPCHDPLGSVLHPTFPPLYPAELKHA